MEPSEEDSTQLRLPPLEHSQLATETTDQMERTALERPALEPTDQWTDQLEPHALEPNQMISHITTLTQLPEDHTRPVVISPQPPQSQPLLIHGQLPRPSSKPKMTPSPPKLRRSPFSRPHTATPTPLSTEQLNGHEMKRRHVTSK